MEERITSASAWSFPISCVNSEIIWGSEELVAASSSISLPSLLIFVSSIAILSSNFVCHSISSSSVSEQNNGQLLSCWGKPLGTRVPVRTLPSFSSESAAYCCCWSVNNVLLSVALVLICPWSLLSSSKFVFICRISFSIPWIFLLTWKRFSCLHESLIH